MSRADEYRRLKKKMLQKIKEDYGPRCETKDTKDFPELEGKTELVEGRCAVCLLYEHFDGLWKVIRVGSDNS